jgi:hypothetical protein
MSEKIPTPKSAPSQVPEKLEVEAEKKLRSEPEDPEGQFEIHPTWRPGLGIVQESPEKCAEIMKKFEAMFDDFERTHDLEALHAITDVTNPEEAERYPVRQQAKADLVPIFKLRRYLREQQNISKEVMEIFEPRYKKIQSAIGSATDNGIDHSVR